VRSWLLFIGFLSNGEDDFVGEGRLTSLFPRSPYIETEVKPLLKGSRDLLYGEEGKSRGTTHSWRA
jgi:hypothetical protein